MINLPFSYPKFKAFDNDGEPLNGGKLFTYKAGTATEQDTYTDSDLTVPHSNPIVLDSNGEAEIYLNGNYKFILKDSTESQTFWTIPEYNSSNFDPYTYYPDATEDDQGAIVGGLKTIKDIVDAVGSDQATIRLQHSSGSATTEYTFKTTLTIPSNIKISFDNGSIIQDHTDNPDLTINSMIDAEFRQKIFSWINGTGDLSINDTGSVMWFGATGDGSTDDYASIQQCLDSVGRGRTVFPEPDSAYQIGTRLEISNRFAHLQGNRYNDVIIRTTGDVDGIYAGNIDGVKLEYLQIINTAAAGDARGVDFSNCHNWSMEKIVVSAFVTGFWMYNDYIGVMTDCEAKNNTGVGFHFQYQCNDLNLYHCSSNNNAGDGIYIKGATGSTVSGRAFVIHGGDIEFNDDYQIRIRDSVDVTIQGVYFEQSTSSNVLYDINIDSDTYVNKQVNILNCSFSRGDTGDGTSAIYADDVDVLNILDNYIYVSGDSTSRNPLLKVGDVKIANVSGNRGDAGGGSKYGLMALDYYGKIAGRKCDNIVRNAGFLEYQTSTRLEDWSATGGTCIQSTSKPTGHPGDHFSMQWTQTASGEILTSDLVDVLPSTYYWASIWINEDSGADIGVRIYADSGALLCEAHEDDIAESWRKYHFCFQTQSTTSQIQWYIYWKNAGTRSVYIWEPMFVQGTEPGEFAIRKPAELITKFAYDFPNIADGAGSTTNVTVLGAELGDFVQVSCELDIQNMILTGWVQSADTVYIRLQNESGIAVNLASTNFYIKVTKRTPL